MQPFGRFIHFRERYMKKRGIAISRCPKFNRFRSRYCASDDKQNRVRNVVKEAPGKTKKSESDKKRDYGTKIPNLKKEKT